MSSRWDNPPADPGSSRPQSDAAAAAAAAAAKIAAQFAPPPSSSSGAADRREPRGGEPPAKDAEFVHDIEINDQKNRYMLTKGQTQAQIHNDTGAVVTTKGTWYPDKSMATRDDPPLYLHITAVSREMLDAAIAKVEELMAQDLPQLIEDRGVRRPDQERPRERRKWPEEKVPINLESIRNFNIRSKIVGPGGMFVKYIQAETNTRVQIKGIGSGFIESETGMEADEPMHISIAGPDEEQLKAARVLAEDLVDAVKTEWKKAQDALNQGIGGYGGAPGYAHGQYQHQQPHGQQPHGQQPQGQQQQWQQWDQAGYGQPQPPMPDGQPPPPPPPEDEAPPPPPAESQTAEPTPAMSPEEEQLDKYWREYVTWEESFVAYHNRKPTKEEGWQDAPSKYRK